MEIRAAVVQAVSKLPASSGSNWPRWPPATSSSASAGFCHTDLEVLWGSPDAAAGTPATQRHTPIP